MSRVLLLGAGPLPGEPARMHGAHGLRALQFCQALAGAGHRVHLVTFGPPGGGGEPAGVTRRALAPGDVLDRELLGRVLREAAPDVVVAAGSYHPALAALHLPAGPPPTPPLWLDLAGDLPAEGQLRAAEGGERALLDDHRGLLWGALRRGDRFSVVSGPQRLALLGQLGLAGRLGDVGREPVSVVRPAAWPVPLREEVKEGFLVVSSGAFNTWMDADTLFGGLERAMAQSPAVRFAAAGGPVPGHSERAHARLVELVRGSPYRSRFQLMGWLLPEDLARLHARAHLGICLDRPCLEAELGSRNRLLDWLSHSLPAVVTPLCELARTLCEEGHAHPVPPGDPDALAALILRLSRDPEALRQQGRRARDWVTVHHSVDATTHPLLEWVAAPDRAPATASDYLDGELETTRAENRRLQNQLQAIRKSPAFRAISAAMRLRDVLRRRK